MAIIRGTIGEIVETERNSKDDLSVEWRMRISDFLRSDKTGDMYLSPDFEFGDERWHMKVCMNWGGWTAASKAVDICVARNSDGADASAKTVLCTFGLRTPNGVEKNVGYSREVSGNYKGFGVSGLWERSDLMEDGSKLMPGGVLVVTCDLKRIEPGADANEDNKVEDVSVVIPPDLESLSRDLGRLLKGGLHPDIKLQCGDRIVPAHRCVLSARSRVFAQRIRSDAQGDNTGLVDVSDLGVDVDLFLQYVYAGELPKRISVDFLPDLYATANQFDMDALKSSCRDAMIRHLAESNCIDFLALADKHGDEDFKKAVVDFICQKKIDLLMKSEAWKKFADENPKMAREVQFESRRASVFREF